MPTSAAVAASPMDAAAHVQPGCSAAVRPPPPGFWPGPRAGAAGAGGAARAADRFEREADSFFSRVRNAYLDRAHAEPARIRVLDARHSIAELQTQIGQLLQTLT
jgi:hypothetical protein